MSPELASDPRVMAALEAAVAAGEVGVQVAAYLDGELVVDAWIGGFGPGDDRQVDGDTLFSVFSITKIVTATAAHLQVQRGLLDYDRPVAETWPEFGAHGKDGVTLGHVLAHRSGVPQVPHDVTVDRLGDWDWMAGHIAGLEPVAPPDTMNAYSPIAFGWLVGELVRRTDPEGRSYVDFVRQEVLAPLGLDDFHIGL
ncbi:MAG: serine hydrolase domain-containing protein, partial [Aeromicrobium sp.]